MLPELIFFAAPKTREKNNPFSSGQYKTVLTVWHIDTFEGGTGSRADFLSSSLKPLSNDGVVTFVKTQTTESMEKAFEKYYTQKYFDVIKILEKIEPILPVELLAEKDLLLSLVLTKTLNQMDRIKALEILKPYRLISSVNNEFDLWHYHRILVLNLIVYIIPFQYVVLHFAAPNEL